MKNILILSVLFFALVSKLHAQVCPPSRSLTIYNYSSCMNGLLKVMASDAYHTSCTGLLMSTTSVALPSPGNYVTYTDITDWNSGGCCPGIGWCCNPPLTALASGDWEVVIIKPTSPNAAAIYLYNPGGMSCSPGTGTTGSTTPGCAHFIGFQAQWTLDGCNNSIVTITDY